MKNKKINSNTLLLIVSDGKSVDPPTAAVCGNVCGGMHHIFLKRFYTSADFSEYFD